MNEHQRLFLTQAQSDFVVFELLGNQPALPACHASHSPQRATEMLGKAHAWKTGPNFTSHRAIVGFLRSLSTNRAAQRRHGYGGRNEGWSALLRSSPPLAELVEDLAPSHTPDGPNPEYPWPRTDPSHAPAEHVFELWATLRDTPRGRQFLDLLRLLLATAEVYL